MIELPASPSSHPNQLQVADGKSPNIKTNFGIADHPVFNVKKMKTTNDVMMNQPRQQAIDLTPYEPENIEFESNKSSRGSNMSMKLYQDKRADSLESPKVVVDVGR